MHGNIFWYGESCHVSSLFPRAGEKIHGLNGFHSIENCGLPQILLAVGRVICMNVVERERVRLEGLFRAAPQRRREHDIVDQAALIRRPLEENMIFVADALADDDMNAGHGQRLPGF